ncbi:ubiquitin carboxyl-terminal hydrolase [Striga asiatica]|uniref:Ubiquitin carboxyl-terminal hydrolase n=1 Tax=Striga asiatica TaxID=4170 RepID=A0A5A7QCW6_STRAF|nr:ubiquitin carboxyl-terminal hydrolase [Striga asiatica]
MSRRLLSRLSIDKALLHLPSLAKSSLFLLSLLRRLLSKSLRFMDSLLFSNDDDAVLSTFDHSFLPPSFSDPGESLFLVPFRWWKDAMCGGCRLEGADGVRGVLYNAMVQLNGGGVGDGWEGDFIGGFRDSEILVGMRREEEAEASGEEGVSGGSGDLALVSEWMFFTTLKWHFDRGNVESSYPGGDSAHDLFTLKIRLLFMSEERHLVIKISEKLYIWDFSGQTNQLFGIDTVDSGQPNEEVRLDLKIFGLPSTINDEERQNGYMQAEESMIGSPSTSSPHRMNGCVDKVNKFSRITPEVGSGPYCTGSLGLTGLYNLGNTCFMNSAIQCLVHTPKLVDYFLANYRRDLNCENPLGMNGKLAIAFGDLLRKLWSPGATPVAPRMFKSTIASFAPQFSGYNQHDSQEFLSFLLDGLHEDLNHVKTKPYVQAKDEDGRPDDEVADEYWNNHLSRNDSIIVDLCQGQYRSTLVCPVCKKLSITFDPFMYLSLPLPCSKLRTMTLTVLSSDGTTMPHPVTIRVPDDGTLKDLIEALGIACSLREDETLLITEIFGHSILRILNDPGDSIELIRDYDKLVAYRLPKDMDESSLVVFLHQEGRKKFGIPLVARIPNPFEESDLRKQFLNLINPFLLSGEELLNDDASQKITHEDELIDFDGFFEEASISNNESDSDVLCDFEFSLERSSYVHFSPIKLQMDIPMTMSSSGRPIQVLVSWPEKMVLNYDTAILSLLPEVCRGFNSKYTQDSISLYSCVDAFLKEEPLGPEDMWYCPNCKEHRQASKKLDLWRLPEILVIHLKRFSYTRFLKNKLEAFVDFPIDELDLSNYVIRKINTVGHRYMLFAMSNHYGGMGGGHYTAFAKHKLDRWYEFDDGRVNPVTEEQIKTQAAYVLFYKRI